MSRRQFAAYLLAGFLLLSCVDAILHPDVVTRETGAGMLALIVLAIIVHPREDPMTLLSETAHVLTHTHKRVTATEDGDVWGDEPALLVTLAECVTNPSSNGGAGGNTTRAGLPINADAHDLLERIGKVVNTCWPGNGDPAYVRVPLHVKLNAWVTHTTDPVAEGVLLDLCRQWTAQVRELLEPTRKVPVPGVACPTCGWDKTYREDDNGDFIPAPALIAYPEKVPVVVVCTVESCGAQWAGPEVTDTFMRPVTVESTFM